MSQSLGSAPEGTPAGPQVAPPRFLIEADVSNGTGASHIGNARASAVPALRTRGFAAGAPTGACARAGGAISPIAHSRLQPAGSHAHTDDRFLHHAFR